VFHNARSGVCFPSYKTIAAKAGCARSTVAEAIKALGFAGVLTWQNRLVRVRERCPDLWGKAGRQWRVVRTSNAYVFRDPQQPAAAEIHVLPPQPAPALREHTAETAGFAGVPEEVEMEPFTCTPLMVKLASSRVPTAGLVSQAALSTQLNKVPLTLTASCSVAWRYHQASCQASRRDAG
jgi:hypothetical protein